MALEIKETQLPTFFELVYDNMSELTYEDHRDAFIDVAKGFLENILLITHKDIEVLIPKHHYRELLSNTLILLRELLIDAEDFLRFLYNSDEFEFEFEFNTRLQIENCSYKLMLNNEPVVLMLKKN